MKKIILFISLLSFISPIFSQTSPEDYYSIQRFVEATVQIPFMARVADVQGAVSVRVTINSQNNNYIYEIEKGLRPDCDLEALRVVKLIHLKNLKELMVNKNTISIQVPFYNKEVIKFEDGYVLNYFNKLKRPTNIDTEIKFVRKSLVDTITGIMQKDAEYFEYNEKKAKRVGIAFLMIDSSRRNVPELFENQADSIKIFKYSLASTSGFLNVYSENFPNGQVSFKETGNISFYYYPNGRIKTIANELLVDSEKVVHEVKWYANGQVASYSTYYKNEPSSPHKFIMVWDTLGKKLVENGEGIAEFYSHDGIETGMFKSGFKDGFWVKKTNSGQVEYREKYDFGNLLSGTKYLGQDSINYDIVDVKASFIGGMKNLGKHLITNLKYPKEAQRAGIQGTVLVEFTVCTDGTLCDYSIARSVDESVNNEALRVVKLTNGKWKSGKNRGVPVRTRYTLPVTFQSLGLVEIINR